MPSIQILSDLHLEAPKGYDVFEITPTAPHLALLGDIGCVEDPGYFVFLEKQLPLFKTVFLLLGNHEPYRSSWATARAKLRLFETDMAEKKKTADGGHLGSFVFLDQTRHDLSPTLTVLGCTLFTHVPPPHADHVSSRLKDFHHIAAWTLAAHNAAHAADLAWLNAQVAALAAAEPHRALVILTHHSPTTRAAAVDPAHAQSPVGSGFATDLARESCWTAGNVRAWAFGHTHFNCDFVAEEGGGEGGLRVLTNQRGYCFRESAGFDGGKCVEV